MYRSAILNISADAFTDSRQGIFKSANEGQAKLLHLSEIALNYGSLYAHFDVSKNLGYTLLQSRTWVLQESVLSPRRLRYINDQVYWSCGTTTYCNELQSGNTLEQNYVVRVPSIEHAHFQRLAPRLDTNEYKKGDAQSLLWWYQQVNDHTRRRLICLATRTASRHIRSRKRVCWMDSLSV
jgi:hypothetical protein